MTTSWPDGPHKSVVCLSTIYDVHGEEINDECFLPGEHGIVVN